MLAHEGVEIIDAHLVGADDEFGGAVSDMDPFPAWSPIDIRSYRSGRGPDEPAVTRKFLDGLQERRKGRPVLGVRVLPTMHAVVEMNDCEPDILKRGKLGHLMWKTRIPD